MRHVAKALAYQATLQGYEVGFVEANSAFAHCSLANPQEQGKLLRDLLEPDLLGTIWVGLQPCGSKRDQAVGVLFAGRAPMAEYSAIVSVPIPAPNP